VAAPATPKPAVAAPPVAKVAVAAKPTPPPAATKPRVTVRLASDPQGADVFDAQGGASLGTTPLTLARPRGAVLKIRLEKDGYLSSTREVPLDEDQALEFALTRKAAPKPRPSHHVREEGPAKL
jgi:PEGA domain